MNFNQRDPRSPALGQVFVDVNNAEDTTFVDDGDIAGAQPAVHEFGSGFAVLVIRGGNPRTTELNFTIGLVVPGDFLALLYIHDAEFDAWYNRAGPGFDAELFFR